MAKKRARYAKEPKLQGTFAERALAYLEAKKKEAELPWCLGPGETPHRFLGKSPGERVCPACRRTQDALRLSPRMFECHEPQV